MKRVFSLAFMALGVSAMAIGAAIFLFGAQPTADVFAAAFAFLGGTEARPALGGADIDSELRFYAVFWIAYGAIVVATARRLDLHKARVPLLLALFFAGGAGRALGGGATGWPHPLFVSLMTIELVLPLALYALWRAARP
jgi:hypothetical protein